MRMNSWMLYRDAVVVIFLLFFLGWWIWDGSSTWASILLFLFFFIFLLMDSSNEKFMQGMYKLLGYISEDESFDAGYYESQKRRRYSISFLNDGGFVQLDDPDYIKRMNKQETIITLNYQDLPEPKRTTFIRAVKLWTKYTYAITFAIKRKIAYDKELRAMHLEDRINVMKNVDEDSVDEFDEELENGNKSINRSVKSLKTKQMSPTKMKELNDSPILRQSSQVSPRKEPVTVPPLGKGKFPPDNEQEKLKDEEMIQSQRSQKSSGRKKVEVEDPKDKSDIDLENMLNKDEENKDENLDDISQHISQLTPSDNDSEDEDYGRKDENNNAEDKQFNIKPEEKFEMPEGGLQKVLFIIFFPVNLLAYFLLPNIRIKPNLSKVLITCMALLVLQVLFALGMFLHIMVLIRAFRIKQSIAGFVNGFVSTAGYVIYGYSIRNHSKEYNYFITAQEYSIFRWAFMFGLMQMINMLFLSVKPSFYTKLPVYTWIVAIGTANILAVIYNMIMKGMWHWGTGIVSLILYAGCIAIILIF